MLSVRGAQIRRQRRQQQLRISSTASGWRSDSNYQPAVDFIPRSLKVASKQGLVEKGLLITKALRRDESAWQSEATGRLAEGGWKKRWLKSRKFTRAYFDDVLRCPLYFLQPLQDHFLVGWYVEFLSFQIFDFFLYSARKREEAHR